LKAERQTLELVLNSLTDFIECIKSCIGSLRTQGAEDTVVIQEIEVKHYQESILAATLDDDMDNLIAFLEELIRKFKEDKAAQDKFMFRQLSDDDKELLGPLLAKITSSKLDFKYA
jgi:hypothetical protein